MARGRPSKKQLILDTALSLFTELGYQGTSIDLVVQRAGVSKPTVYNNFPAKQDLWLAAVQQLLEQAEPWRNRIASEVGKDPLRRIQAVFESMGRDPQVLALYRIMLGEQHKMAEPVQQLFEDFENQLRDWCRAQWPASEMPGEGALFAVIALCREALLIPSLSNQPQLPREVLQEQLNRQL